MFFETLARSGAELVDIPSGLGHADDRHIEMTAFDHRLEGWEDFFIGEIASGAEKD